MLLASELKLYPALTYLVAIDSGDWGVVLMAFLLDYRSEARLNSNFEWKKLSFLPLSLRAFLQRGIELHLQGRVPGRVLHRSESLTAEGLEGIFIGGLVILEKVELGLLGEVSTFIHCV